jgi:uncharacterized membrane protein YhaH (DUF805 family)
MIPYSVRIVFGLSILLAAVLVVALEKSDRRLSRGQYAMRVAQVVAGFIGVTVVGGMIASTLAKSSAEAMYGAMFGVEVINWMLALLVYRAMVQRLRDGGRGKGLAYVAVIPIVSLVIAVVLMFHPPTARA